MLIDLLKIVLLVTYTVVSVAGMVLIKAADHPVSIKGGMGLALYVAGFLLWIGVILRLMPLSQAFPIAAGALMVGTQLAGWFFLQEKIGTAQMAGVVLIMSGVFLVGMPTQGNA